MAGKLRETPPGLTRIGSDGKHVTYQYSCSCGRVASIRPDSPVFNTPPYICRHCRSSARALKHGGYASSACADTKVLQSRWDAMLKRCDPTRKRYASRYADRGIGVCAAWLKFDAFRDWALANGFCPKLFLDRKKNSKGYSPSNCRWVTPRSSAINRDSTRSVRCVESGATFESISLASEFLKCSRYAVGSAIKRRGKCAGLTWEFV